jgi:WD40 repeat protein
LNQATLSEPDRLQAFAVRIFVAMLIIPAGAPLTGAALGGQVGLELRGQVGLEVGETAGALLGALLAAAILFAQIRPSVMASRKSPRPSERVTDLVVSVALIEGGVLWLLLSGGPAGIEVRRIADPSYVHSIALFGEGSMNGRPAVAGMPELCRWPSNMVPMSGMTFFEPPRLSRAAPVPLNQCVAVAGDGRPVIGTEYGTLTFWERESNREKYHVDSHQRAVLAVVFSPDGRRVLSAGLDRTIRAWDAASGQEVGRQDLPVSIILSACFSADSVRALTGGMDGSVRLWELGSGQEWQELRRFEGHRSGVTSVAFSPDGRRVVSGSRDWTVRLWDVDSARQVCVFRQHNYYIHSVAFAADGRTVLSGGVDETIRMWQPPE